MRSGGYVGKGFKFTSTPSRDLSSDGIVERYVVLYGDEIWSVSLEQLDLFRLRPTFFQPLECEEIILGDPTDEKRLVIFVRAEDWHDVILQRIMAVRNTTSTLASSSPQGVGIDILHFSSKLSSIFEDMELSIC